VSRSFRVTERLQVTGLVEAFNLLNRANKMIPNNIFGNGPYPQSPAPFFGTPTAVGDPREIQLALRLTF
jgi:hypothetical protein